MNPSVHLPSEEERKAIIASEAKNMIGSTIYKDDSGNRCYYLAYCEIVKSIEDEREPVGIKYINMGTTYLEDHETDNLSAKLAPLFLEELDGNIQRAVDRHKDVSYMNSGAMSISEEEHDAEHDLKESQKKLNDVKKRPDYDYSPGM